MFDTRWAKGGTTALYLRHTYNAKGQVSNIADLAPGGVNRAYSYDALGRLTNASGPWGNGSYSYDALSNLRSRVVGADVVNINYNGLNLVSNITGTAGNRTYIHDARGNVISDGRYGFYNNMSDQPVALNGDATSSYMYDGNKKRVRVWTDDSPSAELIYSVYSASGTLLTRDNATTGVETDYVTAGAGGKTFARRKGGVWSYIHGDHLGSVTTVTNASGAVLFREEYRPFGETQLNPAANKNDTGFTGHIKDADTGLNYMQARYYDPLIGRFLSVDPVGFSVGRPFMFGRYSYVGNDPVNATDPDGKDPCTSSGCSGQINISTGAPIKRSELALKAQGAFIIAGTGVLLVAAVPEIIVALGLEGGTAATATSVIQGGIISGTGVAATGGSSEEVAVATAGGMFTGGAVSSIVGKGLMSNLLRGTQGMLGGTATALAVDGADGNLDNSLGDGLVSGIVSAVTAAIPNVPVVVGVTGSVVDSARSTSSSEGGGCSTDNGDNC